MSESALTARINATRTAVSDDGDQQRLIRTIPRKGIRFVGLVQERAQPEGEAPRLLWSLTRKHQDGQQQATIKSRSPSAGSLP